MKKSICLYFHVHQPTRLRLFRFFDIGKSSHYYDDFTNRTILKRVAQKCYLPANALLLDLIQRNGGNFKVSFSITGSIPPAAKKQKKRNAAKAHSEFVRASNSIIAPATAKAGNASFHALQRSLNVPMSSPEISPPIADSA